jgi:hypothetical protein
MPPAEFRRINMDNMQARGFDLHSELPALPRAPIQAGPAVEQTTPGMPPMEMPQAQPELAPHWEDVDTFLSALNGPGAGGEAGSDAGSPMFQGVEAIEHFYNDHGDDRGSNGGSNKDFEGSFENDAEGGSLWSKLAAVPDLLHGKREQLESAMLKAARGADQAAMYEVSKRMSELYLEQGLAVKVLSKTTSSIEQIMKMQ